MDFDRALVAAVFDFAGRKGWRATSVAAAAREAGLDLGRARLRCPGLGAVLMRFGQLADAAALRDAPATGPARDRLFDMLMRRIDVLQAHREGMLALLRALPADPRRAMLLACLSQRSMGWMLEAAGISARGPLGALRSKALLGVWLWTLRAWQGDESADLGATMAALDTALRRAEQVALSIDCGARRGGTPADPEPAPADQGPEPDPATASAPPPEAPGPDPLRPGG